MEILTMKKRLIIILGLLSLTLAADNLQLNGGFELGTGGYSTDRHLDPAKNPSLQYLQPQLDDSLPNSGKYAIKLANPYGEFYVFYGKEFFLKKDVSYQVSCYARAERDGYLLDLSLLHYSAKYQHQGRDIAISAGSAWKKFSFSFTSPIDGAYYLRFTNNYQAGTVWIDDISVTQLNDSAPDAAEAVFQSARKTYFAPDNQVVFTGYFKGKPGGELTVTAENDYDKSCYEIKKFRRSNEDTEKRDFTWTPPRYGTYRLKVADPDFRQADGYFAYFKPVQKVDFNPEKVMPGCNGGIVINGPYRFRTIGYEYSEITPQEHAVLLGKIGVRTVRMHDSGGNSWAVLEPEDGKFDFSSLDAAHDLLAANGVQQLMIIASNDTFSKETQGWTQKGFPDWLKQKDCTVKDKGDSWQYLAPEKYWRRYVGNIVRHCRQKNYAPVFEIINEPQFHMTAEEYMTHFLIPASEEIRSEWNEAKVVGVCSTSDFGAKIGPFAQGCLDLGAGKYVDAVSFHPYGSREINSSDPADKQIQSLQKLFVFQGKSIPLWENELYYLFDGPSMTEWYRSGRPQAHQIPIRYIIDIGEGCAQVMPVHTNQLWTRTLIPSIEGSQSNEGNLSAGAIAFSVMSDFLTGATPVASLRPRNGLAAYVFRDRNNEEVAACWFYQNSQGVKLNLANFEAWDLFGNPITSPEYAPGPAPVWLKAKNKDALAGQIAALEVIYENPLSVSGVTRFDGKDFIFTATNHSNGAVTGHVMKINGNGFASKSPVEFKVGANSSAPVRVPALSDPKQQNALSIALYCNGKRSVFPSVLKEIKSAVPGEKMRIGNKAEASFLRDGNFLVLTVKVNDMTPSPISSDKPMWEQDGIELFLEPAPYDISGDPEKCGNYIGSTFRVFVLPRQEPSKQLTVWPMNNPHITQSDIACQVTTTPDGYVAVLKIPIDKLQLPNALALDIKVNDVLKTDETPMQSIWSSTKPDKAWKDRSEFGLLTW